MSDLHHIKNLIKNNLYCSVSTVSKEGFPHVSPIGSVYLQDQHQGYFIEMFSKSCQNHAGNKACIMAVNTSITFWIKSLFKGRFATPPAVRLLVTLEEKRAITPQEMARFHRRVRFFRKLKGYQLMWSSARFVRPFTVDKVIPVKIGKMTAGLTSS